MSVRIKKKIKEGCGAPPLSLQVDTPFCVILANWMLLLSPEGNWNDFWTITEKALTAWVVIIVAVVIAMKTTAIRNLVYIIIIQNHVLY